MYKPIDKQQNSFLDFNQPMGLHMNPDNRWIKLADRIPWDAFEIKYAKLFASDTGNVARPLRMALGTLVIQTKFQYAGRELVEQITENPYLQYFIGLPGYQEEALFDASMLVLFRKLTSAEMLMELNEYLLASKDDKNDSTPPSSGSSGGNDTSKEDTNEGTLTLDATCAPANIRYLQDVSLLNEAREKLKSNVRYMTVSDGANIKEIEKSRLKKYNVTIQTKCVVLKIKTLWNSSGNYLYGMDKNRVKKCIPNIEDYVYVPVNNNMLAKAEIPFLIFERNRGKCFTEMYQ